MLERLIDENFRTRVLTALIAGPLALGLIILSWQTTALLLSLLLVLAAYEYAHIVQRQLSRPLNNWLFGLAYLLVPLIAGLWLRRYEPHGLDYLLLVLVTIWVTDSCALIGGKLWGQRPFAPRTSPNKTWEGVAAGLVGGLAGALLTGLILGLTLNLTVLVLAVLIPPASVTGDLLESRLKRRFGVKDSGDFFPGHGGVLDRIDSPLFCLPIAALIVFLLG